MDYPLGCLEPGCGSIRCLRSRCVKHHSQARRDIAKGKTTWATLDKLGRALPSQEVEASRRWNGEHYLSGGT